MSHIFVSHATTDDKAVSQISERLKAAGLLAWIDHEHGIEPSDDWGQEIHDAANNCSCGLFVLTATSAKSSYCRAEWTRVLALGKRLYILMLSRVSVPDIPLRLGTIQYTDLTRDYEGGLSDLIQAIQNQRDLDPASPTTAQANPVSGSFPRWHLDVPLIGRESELVDAQKSLADNSRATAVLGLGGIGKTRLAAEIVAKTPFKDGAVWQFIQPHTSLNDLTLLIRDHLGLPPTSEAEAVWQALGNKALLIVLDNAEDCTAPAAYAERINNLDLSGGTRLLMTSREQWTDVRGMTRVTLKAPNAEAAASIVKAMAAYEKPDLWQEGHEAEMAAAARYHPRLMWYAVQWSNDAPPDEVLHMLRTLEGSDPEKALDDLVRKTVKRMMEQPGGEAAHTALRKLAVCRGGFTREAAGAIAAEVESLKLLRRYGLVTLEGQRYFVDPLVIAAVGEDELAYRSHYDYYYELAQQHDKKQDYLGLDPESANLEAAFEWAMAAGDGEDALWLANASSNFLFNRGRFAQILSWDERIVEALTDHPDKMLLANAQNSLAIDYQNNPLGDKGQNLRRAIAAYQAALVHYTPQAAPLAYAMTQNNLGNAYSDLAALEEREVNLKRAIAAFEAALVHYTPQAAPLDYAMTHNNLGTAYSDLATLEEPEANLKRAIAAYQAALEYRTPQAAPLDYAGTQNNLGIAYRDLAALEEREANLKRAIAAYQAALVHYTPQAAPLHYATTQNNLGTAYSDLAALEEPEANLKRAIAAYQAALVHSTPQAAPLAYAMTQMNLAGAYAMLSDIENRESNLQEAVTAYEKAGHFHTSSTAPLDYAKVQHGLGMTHKKLGDLPAAIACWREAEKYYRQMGVVEQADLMLRWIADAENAGR